MSWFWEVFCGTVALGVIVYIVVEFLNAMAQ